MTQTSREREPASGKTRDELAGRSDADESVAVAPPPRVRAEHLGRLPTPAALAAVRARAGEDSDALAEAEAEALGRVVAIQRDCGVPLLTDGWLGGRPEDFLQGLEGVEPAGASKHEILAGARLRFPPDHPWLQRLSRLAGAARTSVKIDLPGPALWRVAAAPDALEAYRDREAIWDDVAAALSAALSALHQAGCRYVQIERISGADDGVPPPGRAVELLATALHGAPPGVSVALRVTTDDVAALTRQFGGAAGAADALASLGVPAALTPYLGLAPEMTEALAAGQGRLMLGAIPAKGALPKPDSLLREIDRAASVVGPEKLGLTLDGHLPEDPDAEDEARRRLDLLVATAERVWGDPES